MYKIEIGTQAKRKQGNKEIVEVKDFSGENHEYVVIQDSNGRQFVRKEHMTNEFFDFIEPVVSMEIE